MGQSRDEILSIIKPAVVGWIDDVLQSSPAVSSQIFVSSGGATPSGAASGDLAGSYPGPTVDGLQGRAVSATAPTSGQVYVWNGSLWLPGSISSIAGTITDAQHGARGGGSLHAAATTSALGFVELATSGETAAGVVVQGNDARLADARTPTGAASGDLAGSYPGPTVDGLQGRAVSATAPTTGQVLGWDGATWAPQSQGATRGTRLVLRKTAFQSIPYNTDTAITWDSEVTDEGGWFSGSGSVITLPAGVYDVYHSFVSGAGAVGAAFRWEISLTGGIGTYISQVIVPISNLAFIYNAQSCKLVMPSAGNVEVVMYHGFSGGPLSVGGGFFAAGALVITAAGQ